MSKPPGEGSDGPDAPFAVLAVERCRHVSAVRCREHPLMGRVPGLLTDPAAVA